MKNKSINIEMQGDVTIGNVSFLLERINIIIFKTIIGVGITIK